MIKRWEITHFGSMISPLKPHLPRHWLPEANFCCSTVKKSRQFKAPQVGLWTYQFIERSWNDHDISTIINHRIHHNWLSHVDPNILRFRNTGGGQWPPQALLAANGILPKPWAPVDQAATCGSASTFFNVVFSIPDYFGRTSFSF